MAMKLWHNANLQKFPFRFFFHSLSQPPHVIVHANCMSTAWIDSLGTSKTHSSW